MLTKIHCLQFYPQGPFSHRVDTSCKSVWFKPGRFLASIERRLCSVGCGILRWSRARRRWDLVVADLRRRRPSRWLIDVKPSCSGYCDRFEESGIMREMKLRCGGYVGLEGSEVRSSGAKFEFLFSLAAEASTNQHPAVASEYLFC